MTFEEIVAQAIDMVRRRGRVTSRMLKRQFELNDTYLDDLKYELIAIHQIAVDQDGKMLVWTGDPAPPEPDARRGTEAAWHFQTLLPEGGDQEVAL